MTIRGLQLSVKSKNPRWRGDLASRALDLTSRALDSTSRALDFVSGALDFVSRGLHLVTSGLHLVSRALDFVSRELDFVTSGLHLVSRELDFVSGELDLASRALDSIVAVLLQIFLQSVQFARQLKRQMFAENFVKLANRSRFGAPLVNVHARQFVDGVGRQIEAAQI